jgi:hypothetical protein
MYCSLYRCRKLPKGFVPRAPDRNFFFFGFLRTPVPYPASIQVDGPAPALDGYAAAKVDCFFPAAKNAALTP